jgi:hypothetical protein
MRTPIRLLASTFLGVALLASLGVGSTLAKGTVETYQVNDAWCFQDDPELYCSFQEGTMTIVTKDDGSSVGRLDAVVTVDITANGAFVASYRTITREVTRSASDGSYSFTWSDKTRRTDGEGTCKIDMRFKIIDFHVVYDSLKGTCD